MLVRDAMTRAIETTSPGGTIQAVALKMREASVGMLPVVEGGQVIGVVTDRDITVRGAANGLDPKTSHVADVMTRRVITCYEDQTIEEAERTMEEHTVRRLVVLDRGGRPVGVLSLDDLAVLLREEEVEPEPSTWMDRRAG